MLHYEQTDKCLCYDNESISIEASLAAIKTQRQVNYWKKISETQGNPARIFLSFSENNFNFLDRSKFFTTFTKNQFRRELNTPKTKSSFLELVYIKL